MVSSETLENVACSRRLSLFWDFVRAESPRPFFVVKIRAGCYARFMLKERESKNKRSL